MVDVAAPLPANFQQWTFEKESIRPTRSDSAATTPDLDFNGSLRIEPASTASAMDSNEPFLQRRYLSSEEDLSPLEGDDDDLEDDKLSIHNGDDAVVESIEKATIITAQAAPAKAVGLAISIAYKSAGRPKVIELASPIIKERERKTMSMAPQPSSSMLLDSSSSASSRSSLLKLITSVENTNTKAVEPETRPSTSTASSFSIEAPPRSSMSTTSSSATEEYLKRPQVSRFESLPVNKVRRSSMFVASNNYSPMSPNRPAVVASPVLNPSFLSTDPFASDSRSAASPIIKPPQHKRLRSISRTLSLAKIAVMPNKKNEAKKDVPQSPQTPMSAPPVPSTSYQARRVSSRPMNERMASPEVPMSAGLVENRSSLRIRPTSKHSSIASFGQSDFVETPRSAVRPSTGRKLIARGADEREPTLELPPFPLDADMSDFGSDSRSVTKQRLKKRKSLLSFV